MARLRLSYDDARSRISFLKDQLAKIQDEMIPGQVDSDKDRWVDCIIASDWSTLVIYVYTNTNGYADCSVFEIMHKP